MKDAKHAFCRLNVPHSDEPAPDPSDESTQENTKSFFINLRPHMSVFELPLFEEVARQLDDILDCDDFTLEELKRERPGQYLVHCNKFSDNVTRDLIFELTDRFTDERQVAANRIEEKRERKSGAKTGTLIIIIRSASGALRSLDNGLFDKCFEELGFAVEKGCELQKHRTIDKLNDNRYLVLDGMEHKNIPSQITMVDNGVNHSFYTSYKGK